MTYKDRIYGEIKINEPIILELISGPSLQRLKGIDQAGYFESSFPGTAHSRFEHCLGVFILLRKFGVSLEEQVAGLIHDLSHAVFSHCIDYVLDLGSQTEHNHQDNIFGSFVRKSEIPKILDKYKISLDYILEEKNFPLKERKLPDLCADRLDYSLRTAFIFGEIDKKSIDNFLDALSVKDRSWVFLNFASAKAYAELFLKLNSAYYAGFPSAVMFRTVGDFLKHALSKGYIRENDLYTTDKKVLERAKKYLFKDKRLALLWGRMNNKVKAFNDHNNFEAHVFCKSRIVDPFFKDGDKTRRLSDYYSGWRKIVNKESRPKEYFIRFEK